MLQPLIGIELKMVGHLAYSASNPGAVNVNPKVINFYRQFDMKLLEKSLAFADMYGHHYKHFCSLLRSDPQLNESVILVPNVRWDSTLEHCQNIGHMNFEVKTRKDAKDLAQTLINYQKTKVWAPIKVKHGTLVYWSNSHPNEWLRIKSCATCPITEDLDWIAFQNFKSKNITPFFNYVLDDDNTVYINTTYKLQYNFYVHAVTCRSRIDEETSTFNKLAKHSCKRDVAEIFRTNEFLRNEFLQITNPTENAPTKAEKSRRRRAIALIGAGILGIEALSNAFGAGSPLSSIGKGISYTLGIATHSDVQITRQELQRHAQAIDNVVINQKQLLDGYNTLLKDVQKLTEHRDQTQHDLAVLYVDFDNKINIYRIQSIIQDTLIKMTSAIQSAKMVQTSPFVFGRNDLRNLTVQFRMNNIPLTNSVDDVMTQVTLVENVYTFIFSVPIINNQNNFHLFEVKALPVFKDGEGFSVKFENKYVAVNTATMEYFTTSETEFDYCTHYPICTVSEPFRKIVHDSPCEVRSLKLNSMVCPVVLNEKAKAAFISSRNTTYFSVPKPMEIHVICAETGDKFNEVDTISDYGFFNIPVGCEVKINNEISFRPGFVASVHSLTENSLFQILNFPEDIHEFPVKPNKSATETRPVITLQNVESLAEGFDLIFDHETTIGEVIRILTYVAIFIAIFLIFYCCCKPCRLWFNGCCFLTKPTVYWRKIRGYKVPEFQNSKKTQPSDKASHSSHEIRARTAQQFATLTQRLRNLTADYTFRKTAEPTTTNTYEKAQDEIELPIPPPQSFRTLHIISDPTLYTPKPFPK